MPGLMFGLVAPAATPGAIVRRLSEAAAASVTTDPLRARLIDLGFAPVGSKPEDLRARIEAEITKWPGSSRPATSSRTEKKFLPESSKPGGPDVMRRRRMVLRRLNRGEIP